MQTTDLVGEIHEILNDYLVIIDKSVGSIKAIKQDKLKEISEKISLLV